MNGKSFRSFSSHFLHLNYMRARASERMNDWASCSSCSTLGHPKICLFKLGCTFHADAIDNTYHSLSVCPLSLRKWQWIGKSNKPIGIHNVCNVIIYGVRTVHTYIHINTQRNLHFFGFRTFLMNFDSFSVLFELLLCIRLFFGFVVVLRLEWWMDIV